MTQSGSEEQTQAPESDLSSFRSGSVRPRSSSTDSLICEMGITTLTLHDYYEN